MGATTARATKKQEQQQAVKKQQGEQLQQLQQLSINKATITRAATTFATPP